MPAVSEKQRKFMALVNAFQKGKVKKKVGNKVENASKSMSVKQTEDFMHKKEAALQDWLGMIPMFQNRVQSGDVSESIGKGGLIGVNDLSNDFKKFLNTRERERLMTPMARRMHYMQAQLAKNIGLHMGMTDSQATIAASRISVPLVMAWGMMSNTGMHGMLGQFEQAMNQLGVASPYGIKDPALKQKNERTSIALHAIMQNIINPENASRWGNMKSDEIASIILPRYVRGEYNDILNSRNAFKGNALNPQAYKSLLNRMSSTVSVMGEAKRLFPNDSAQEAFGKLSNLIGSDPIQKYGPETSYKLFKRINDVSSAAGIKKEDVINILANIGTAYKKQGIDPALSFATAADFIAMSAAGRDSSAVNIDPGRFNQSLLSTITEARVGPLGDLMDKTTAALINKVGLREAKTILGRVSSDAENIKSPETFLNAVNSQLDPRLYKLDMDLLNSYENDPLLNKVKMSGISSNILLRHYGDQMSDFRKRILEKQFNFTPDQIRYIESMGGPTIKNVSQYVRGQMASKDPDEVRKRLSSIQSAFDELANNQGFEKGLSVDRFYDSVKNENAVNRLNSIINRNRRIDNVLKQRPQRYGGTKGLMQMFSGDKTQGNWLDSILGTTQITPEQMAEIKGMDYNKLQEPAKRAWEESLKTFINPVDKNTLNRGDDLRKVLS